MVWSLWFGRCGLIALVWSMLFGRCGFAILVGCCGFVAIDRSLCRSVAISLSLWVNCYESVTLKDLRKSMQENSLTHARTPNY